MKLGLHTYSLNLDLDLEGIHLDDGVLERLDPGFLKEVGDEAARKQLYLEYNFSMDMRGQGIGIQHDLSEALDTAHALGADVVKVSMDLVRPHPVSGSRFHPRVMAQMSAFAQQLRTVAPAALDRGIRIAVENHCDSFSEEILWLLDQVDHPSVGACIDTVNALHVTEDPMIAIRNLAPRAFTNHFRDDRIEFQRWGFKLVGAAVGDGDIDMKTAYELFRDQSSMERINIETEMEIPLDDMETALAMEVDAVRRSVIYCREVLGIRRAPQPLD